MAKFKAKQGWYKLNFPNKFKPPSDNHMQSYKVVNGIPVVQYKSSLELAGFKYCDLNPKIKEWSLEPFPIGYLSPVDMKVHRYFPDLWIRFESDDLFIVEIKSSNETKMPRKSDKRYAQKLQTYLINQAKWDACRNFCAEKGANFVILTEKILK